MKLVELKSMPSLEITAKTELLSIKVTTASRPFRNMNNINLYEVHEELRTREKNQLHVFTLN